MSIPDQLKTIVVVMMENRSFDHVLGYLALPQFGGRTDVDGLLHSDTDPAFANEYDHQIYRPFSMSDGPLNSDMPHSRREVSTQLAFRRKRATMSGFVQAYVDLTHSVVETPPILGYMTPASVFMSNFLARNFLVCDRWFAPLPADTQPNRAVAWTGCSLVDDTKGRIIPHRDLVLDWLTTYKVRWRVYHSGLSFFLLFGLLDTALGDKFRSIRQLAGDLATDSNDTAPQVIFVEPEYNDSPIHFGNIPNDNHPPLAIGPGEQFLRDIYATLSRSPRWANTMLIVTYDEHGGFFDHVPPLPIKSAVPAGALYSEPFTTTGVRVPTIIASPFVPSGTCYSGSLDHTSILQLFAEMFAGDRRKYSEDVNLRLDQGIESVSSALMKTQRTDIPVAPATPVMVQQLIRSTKHVLNENQKAFALAGQNILTYDSGKAIGKFPELVHLDTSRSSLSPPPPTVVPDHDWKPRTIKRPSRKRIKKLLKKPKKTSKKATR
ncbi:MAG TPA: alkaline phosphatase family protein [Nitrospiraceae bacterium]|nr:alkaline phosphatase family protein [Nitrospiraceae bacterium]